MPGYRRRTQGLVARTLCEKRLFIQSRGRTRYIRLSPLVQLMAGTAIVALSGWMVVAGAAAVLDGVSSIGRSAETAVLDQAYQARLDELAFERDRRAAEASSAQGRFQMAMDQIGRQQTEILEAVEERRDLATSLDLMRGQLRHVVAERDAVLDEKVALLARMDAVSRTLSRGGASGEDLATMLATVSGALTKTAVARDEVAAEKLALAEQLSALETRVMVNTRQQDEMVNQLEQAVKMTFAPLKEMFENTDVDVDSVLATVRSAYSGQGGPLGKPVVSTRSFNDPELTGRFDSMMIDLDRLNLLRLAAGKIPYAMPVGPGTRLTSPFGYRNHPVIGGRRMHKGIDMAGPSGMPIHATADGVVTSATRERGYGNVVRIKHDFGFETLYAHQSRLRVETGQQVSRGERIGDMGSTGRSTGVHLHYEVRLNGEPIDPMTFLEAAKDVF